MVNLMANKMESSAKENVNKNLDINFNDWFSFVDTDIDNFKNTVNNEKPVLLQLSDKSKYYNGYFSRLNDDEMILLLTPCNLSKYIVENRFLLDHESVVDFIQNAPIAVHATGLSGEIIWANKYEHELLQYDEGQLINKNLIDVSTIIKKYYPIFVVLIR